jgi:cytochrome c
MDTFELNKIIGAVLGTALAVFGIGELTKIVYHTEAPKPGEGKQGYAIEVAEAATGGEATAGGETKAVPLAELLKTADAAKGAAIGKKCVACHDVAKGGPNKIGPNLWDVVERPIAAHEGFNYSDAMKAKAAEAKTWSYENLNQFLTKPSAYVPKTKMTFAGLSDKDRADVLAYLQSLSDSPKPFPAQ